VHPPPPRPVAGNTTQAQHRGSTRNTGTGPAVPPPPRLQQALPAAPMAASSAVRAPKSQEKAKLAANNQAVSVSPLSPPQPGGSNVPQAVPPPKTNPKRDPFADTEG
ncbi:hypothetical protein FS837_005239, partial [Tulasnella sp. UAMH 9824]